MPKEPQAVFGAPPVAVDESLLFAKYQNEIYVAGVACDRPSIPPTAPGLEEKARELLSDRGLRLRRGGRPYAYALGIRGSAALTDFLRGLLADLEITMGLCGLAPIGRDARARDRLGSIRIGASPDRNLSERRLYSLPR